LVFSASVILQEYPVECQQWELSIVHPHSPLRIENVSELELLMEVLMARLAFDINVAINDIALAKNQIWRSEGDLRSEVIACEKGIIWITQQGDPKDHILTAGERFWITKTGMVVAQAVQDSWMSCSRFAKKPQAEQYARLS
jgi:hypothetical protein